MIRSIKTNIVKLTRALKRAEARPRRTLVPCVLDTSVFPTLRTLKISGALMSYHCFLVKGSTLQRHRKSHQRAKEKMRGTNPGTKFVGG